MGLASVVSDVLLPLELPLAPPVTRTAVATIERRKLPAILLLCFGALLVIGPIVGGLFSKVAAGKQMIDQFEPYMDADVLARYDRDIATIRVGAAGVHATYVAQHVAPGRYPGLDQLQAKTGAINARATSLLHRVESAQSDYAKVADIGGFDRVPFLIVICGAVSIYGGCVLRFGARGRARSTALLVTAVSALVVLYPFVSKFQSGASAGHRLLGALTPVMTTGQVRALQGDFIVLVTAVGELDTEFAAVPQAGSPALEVKALVRQWPAVSSDLASLVGTINDNVSNFNALKSLDSIGGRGLEAFPWALVGVGVVSTALSVAAQPRRKKETA